LSPFNLKSLPLEYDSRWVHRSSPTDGNENGDIFSIPTPLLMLNLLALLTDNPLSLANI
jgi:hypothetical protein